MKGSFTSLHTPFWYYLLYLLMKFLFLLFLSLSSLFGLAQSAPVEPAYKRMPTVPALQLLLGDSATKYTKAEIPKNRPVFIMLFSPDCSHCQKTAEEMIAHKEALKDIHIVMATMHTITQMNEFVQKYGLAQLPNLTVGKDIYYILSGFYDIKHLPYMAFYNKKGNLISTIEGGLPIPKVLEIFKDNK
jgi:thioredoxin-related protein